VSLPDLLPFNGDWASYEETLYSVFLETFVHGGPCFRDLPVKAQYRPETKGKGFSFWHVISEGRNEEDRTPDLERCARIRWIAWFIQHAETDRSLCWWENERKGNKHVVIWNEAECFAVVLAKRNGYYLLKTAYVVMKHRAEDFCRERREFQEVHKRLKPPSIST
jgi:hypothetical protein